jgi:signal transduction histidine kinase
MRLGRALRNMGRPEEARAAYARLAAIVGAKVAGAPADLVGRAVLAEMSGRPAEALRDSLLGGRFRLTRGQFEFYWSMAGRLAAREEPPPSDAAGFSEAAAAAWNERNRDAGARGQETLWIGPQPFFVVWRAVPGRRAALIARPASLLKQAVSGEKAMCALADAEGRILAGGKSGEGNAVVRTAAESQLPWTLYVTETKAAADSGLRARQRFLALGMAVMALFLVLGSYLIARAIRKEVEVSRMQSDFVSTVSHEFRSPLTSIRQLSEILALGRAPSEERRQAYYETLVRETARLQRLVEALLNFGRMEAGARQYRFENLDVAALVGRVAAEFEPRAAAAGRLIELDGPERGIQLDADPEAISVALRNLVDNALKYAPDCPTVRVEWEARNGAVSIRVRDRGPGVADAEKKAIFRKFVRGSAAAASNVKGSGVGLAMVRHIVAAHGGEIAVESEPGKGSVFTMLLPAAQKK